MQGIVIRQQDWALSCHPNSQTLPTVALPQKGRRVMREKKLKKLARRQRHQHINASGRSIVYRQKDKTELYLLLLFPHDFQPKHSLYKPLSCLSSCPFFQHLLPREWQNRAGGIFNSHRPASSFDQIQTSHLENIQKRDSDTITPRYKVINKIKTGCYIANEFKFLTMLC